MREVRKPVLLASEQGAGSTPMIAFHLLNIAARKYSADPSGRAAAARMMLINALRLARIHLSDKEAAKLTLDTLQEDARSGGLPTVKASRGRG